MCQVFSLLIMLIKLCFDAIVLRFTNVVELQGISRLLLVLAFFFTWGLESCVVPFKQ